MNEHEHQPDVMQKYWDSQRPLFERIKELGGVEQYVEKIEHLEKMFVTENHDVCCMDERTLKGDIHYAGSGILDQDRAVSRMREAKAAGIYSHAGCGAADLAFKRLSDEEKQTYGNAEEYAKWWAQKAANELGIPYKGHLSVSPGFHIARALYYDGSGTFNPSRSSDFPPGFVISRRYLRKDYAQKELDLSIQIAFGTHGFGKERFNEQTPFITIPIGDANDNHFSLEQLAGEAQEVAKQYGQSVAVDGFVAPL